MSPVTRRPGSTGGPEAAGGTAPRVAPVMEGPAGGWHAASVQAAAARLGVDPDAGLAGGEAVARLAACGPNRLVQPRRVSFWHVLAEELTEPMIVLLLAVAVLYSVWGNLQDAAAIAAVIAAVVLVEVFTEYRAKAAIAALGRLSAPAAPVLRGGRAGEVPAETLVPGDVLVLRPGQRVAADVRLAEAAGLRVDESALTGEPVPAVKDAGSVLPAGTPLAERANLAFAGTTVTAGTGRGVVVATGMGTELGRVTGLVIAAKPPRTALQQAMRELARWLAWLALGFSVLIPAVGIVAGQPWRQMVLTGLTLAFATIPEELPIIITMVLGVGAWRLARRHALVRRLSAAETLGGVSVIAADKTGTLTQNRMTLARLWPAAGPGAGHTVLALAAVCHDATVTGHGAAVQITGDPTDVALLEAARQRGLLPGEPGGLPATVAGAYGFDSARKIMSVTIRQPGRGGEPGLLLVTKGAPEEVLARCTRLLDGGQPRPLTPAGRDRVRGQVEAMAAQGLRVIAVASRPLPSGAGAGLARDEAERDLVLAGLAGLADPPRGDAAGAVRAVTAAGVRVVMVTGDHPATARAVAAQVGLDGGGPLLTGPDLDAMDDTALAQAAASVPVFARVTPEHKLRLVRALHARGQVVAVTGDGINDAPALAAADVGVAMGAGGTDVAREAAGLVLADDNFATITAAVREGRVIYDNLRKGVAYYLACKVALIATTAAGAVLGLPIPFAPIQIVVMEAFMDVAGSLTFTAEPPEADVMARPPRDPRLKFTDRPLISGIFAGAASLFAAVAGIYLGATAAGAPAAQARTLAFTAWMTGYLALAWVMRSRRTPLARLGWWSNRFLPAWTAVTAAALAVIMAVPPVRGALRLTTLTAADWLLVTVVPVAAAAVLEAAKWLAAARRRRRAGPR
jgi:P-type Ca2+ transporter type 2C